MSLIKLNPSTETGDSARIKINKIIDAVKNLPAQKTDAEIKTAYENNTNTNVFTDAQKTKLATIPSTGVIGPQGPKGDKGTDGVIGSNGTNGTDGKDGAKGPKGDKGDKGDTGLQGPKGDPGTGTGGGSGTPGPKGDQGTSIILRGEKPTLADIQAIASPKTGDLWIDDSSDIAYAYDGTTWINAGVFRAHQGADGSDGSSLTLKGNKPKLADIQAITGASLGDIWVDDSTGVGYVWDGSTWGGFGRVRGEQGIKGDPGAGISIADQAKLDLVQVATGSHDMTIDSDILTVGSGAASTAIKLHNPVGHNGVLEGQTKKGTFYVGSFPNSTVHPDDLALSNTGGGLYIGITAGSQFRVKIGPEIHTVLHDGIWTAALLQKLKDLATGLTAADVTKLNFIKATKDVDLDSLQTDLQAAVGDIAHLGTTAMQVNTTPITDMDEITAVGIYFGGTTVPNDHTKDTQVLNAPIPGAIMAMASYDLNGNYGYFLMGWDRVLYTGSKPSQGPDAGKYQWNSAISADGESVKLTHYTKPAATGIIADTDSVNTALGKLEAGLNAATAGGGDKNVQADWTQGDNKQEDFIKNKPVDSGMLPVDKTKLDLVAATKAVDLDLLQDGLVNILQYPAQDKTKMAHISVTKDIDLDKMGAGVSFTDPKIIAVGTDLDTITERGYYGAMDKTNPGSLLLHYPDDGALGLLKVLGNSAVSNHIHQEFIDIAHGKIHTRGYNGIAWGQWMYRDLDTLTPSDVASKFDLDDTTNAPGMQAKIVNVWGVQYLMKKIASTLGKTAKGALRLAAAEDIDLYAGSFMIIPFGTVTVSGRQINTTLSPQGPPVPAPLNSVLQVKTNNNNEVPYKVTYGVNMQLPKGEAVEIMLFRNGVEYASQSHKISDSGIQWGSEPVDEHLSWESYVDAKHNDTFDLRIKSLSNIKVKLTRLVLALEEE